MSRIGYVFKGFWKRLSEDSLSSYASSCAFFIFLSLVPALILLLTILPYTPIDFDLLLKFIERELPGNTAGFAKNIIVEVSERSVGKMSLAAITTLWSAGKGVNSLVTGFNAIDHKKDARNPILVRAVSCLYTLIFLASIIAVLLLVVYGNLAADFISGHFPHLKSLLSVLVSIKEVIAIVIMIFIFMLAYALLPYKHHKIREQFPGAVFAALGWTGFSYVFSLYVNNFNAFSMYGSLTTIIILLVWLYFCMFILLIGANLNRYFRPIILVLDLKHIRKLRQRNRNEIERKQ